MNEITTKTHGFTVIVYMSVLQMSLLLVAKPKNDKILLYSVMVKSMKMQMKSDEKLYFCMFFFFFFNDQHCTTEMWKKMYHLNAFDQNVSFYRKQTDYTTIIGSLISKGSVKAKISNQKSQYIELEITPFKGMKNIVVMTILHRVVGSYYICGQKKKNLKVRQKTQLPGSF